MVVNNNVLADEAGPLVKATSTKPESGAPYLYDSLRREELKNLGGLDAPIIRSDCYRSLWRGNGRNCGANVSDEPDPAWFGDTSLFCLS